MGTSIAAASNESSSAGHLDHHHHQPESQSSSMTSTSSGASLSADKRLPDPASATTNAVEAWAKEQVMGLGLYC